MKRVCNLLIAAVSCSMLFACTTNPQAQLDAAVGQAKKTASGVINPIVDTAKEVEKRVETVKKGVESIQKGVKDVKEALQ